MGKPAVFVETNFLVSLLFPHMDALAHLEARKLLEHNGQECQLFIPYHSIYESFSTVENKVREVRHLIMQLGNLQKSGWLGIPEGMNDQLLSYRGSEFQQERLQLIQQLTHLPLDEDVFQIMREQIIPLTFFKAQGTIDAFILASVFRGCRDVEPTTPRIFMSTNSRDFGKVPPMLLEEYRLLYYTSFDLEDATRLWWDKYGM